MVPDLISEADARESSFEIEIELEVPSDFWALAPERYEDPPQQRRLWEGVGAPYTPEFLDLVHDGLRRRGWPAENIDAMYSYFEDFVWNPCEGEENEADCPVMKFRVSIPGDWLVEHPRFLSDLVALSGEGLLIETPDGPARFKIDYWRIFAEHGELSGADWEDSIFHVNVRRPPPSHETGHPHDWFPAA